MPTLDAHLWRRSALLRVADFQPGTQGDLTSTQGQDLSLIMAISLGLENTLLRLGWEQPVLTSFLFFWLHWSDSQDYELYHQIYNPAIKKK